MREMTIRISGSITIGSGDFQLQNQIRRALRRGYTHIYIDLGNVNYMDSAAVGELAASYAGAQEKDATIILIAPQPKVKTTLQMLTFLDLLPVFDSMEEAQANKKQLIPAAI